jgi:hypothetical protein
MDELVPIALGVLLGALLWAATAGVVRLALSVCAVLVSGLAATVLSGEYHQSWVYLLLDLGEAATGLAVGMLIGRRIIAGRAIARVSPSAEKREHT